MFQISLLIRIVYFTIRLPYYSMKSLYDKNIYEYLWIRCIFGNIRVAYCKNIYEYFSVMRFIPRRILT